MVAFVARASGAGVTAEELQELAAGALTQAHVPREVRFVRDLPMTHADKVDKPALRVRYHHG